MSNLTHCRNSYKTKFLMSPEQIDIWCFLTNASKVYKRYDYTRMSTAHICHIFGLKKMFIQRGNETLTVTKHTSQFLTLRAQIIDI